MFDCRGKHIEIVLGREGQVWVNVDGVCELRSYETDKIIITDERINGKGALK